MSNMSFLSTIVAGLSVAAAALLVVIAEAWSAEPNLLLVVSGWCGLTAAIASMVPAWASGLSRGASST